ncbi:MAG: carboxylesterase family protein [Daejeonella sp.]
MKQYFYYTIFALLMYQSLSAQDKSLYSKEVFIKGGDTLLYRLLLPENFDPSKKYPVLLFLHGAGERGNDNEAQLTHGSKLFLSEKVRKEYPAIVVFPQCPKDDFWANVKIGNTGDRFDFQKGGDPGKSMKLLTGLTDRFRSLKYADKDKFYVGGLSMGGMGTLELLRRKPKTFAAAFSICGGDNIENAKKYKRVPLWFFHGGKDNVVPSEKSKVVVAELERLKAPVKLTIYPEANHNSWDAAFAEPELLSWLLSHEK